jgi:hypothetical protein
MSNLIIDPNDSPIQQPFNAYWDAPLTRKESRVLFTKLAANDSELMGMADTASILLNFICEKLEIKREDVQSYVDRKTEELKALRAAMKAQAETEAGTTGA